MIKIFVALLVAAGALAAADLVVSKDSLKVFNNPVSSFIDEILLKNQAGGSVDLDSALLLVDEMDTTGSGEYGGLGDRFKIRWNRINPVRYDMWSLGKVSDCMYRLTPASSSSSIRPGIYFPAAGDSVIIAFVELGTCLGCSGIPTWYPPYFRGKLQLYFDNGQTVIIRLFSEDMRRFLPVDRSCTDFSCDSMNVRKILDRNGMETYPVSAVSTVSNGRIIAVQFNFNLAAAVTMPVPLTIIPDEIGNLTALRSFSAGGNMIGSISQRIGRCSELQSLNASNNGITALPDSIVNCRQLRTVFLDRNKLTRLPDSIGNLKALRSLSVAGNLLTFLPASVTKLDSANCLFISGNRICTLSEPVNAWVTGVRTNTNCARYEPIWPDSQECTSVATVQGWCAEMSHLPVVTLRTTERVLSITPGTTHDHITAVALLDLAGRNVLSVRRSGSSSITLPIGGLACGVYTVALYSGATIAGVRQVLIDR